MDQKIKDIIKEEGFRTFQIDQPIDEESRTVQLSFSSEIEVDRGGYIEILSHDSRAIDLDLLKKDAPLLLQHDPNKQIGVVVSSNVQDKRGKSLVRFSKSVLGEEIYQDVKDGIRKNVSVGYQVIDAKMLDQKGKDEKPKVLITRWKPFELSIVSIPADQSVGVGRKKEEISEPIPLDEPSIEETNEKSMDVKEEKSKITIRENIMEEKDLKKMTDDAVRTEQKRSAEIIAIADQFGVSRNVVSEHLESGKSVDEFRAHVLNELKTKQPVSTNAELGMSKKEVKQYSLVRAINAATDNRWDRAGLENEVSRALESEYGTKAKGFFVPFDIMKRDIDYDTESTDLVSTQLLGGSFIEQLYKKSVIRNLGAQFLEGIVGKIDIPRMSGGATIYWQAAENTAVTESTPTFDKVSLSPKSMGAIVDISKLLLNQGALSVEQLIINDITRAIAVGIDEVAINGASASDQPNGILNLSVNDVTATSTGLTYSDIVKFETEVATDNADLGALAYLTNAKVRGYLKGTAINSTYGDAMMWQNTGNGEGELNGYRAVASNVVPSTLGEGADNAMIFGNWNDLLVAIFAPGLDLVVDPYTNAKDRLVSVIAYMDLDLGVRHLNSFAKSDDISV